MLFSVVETPIHILGYQFSGMQLNALYSDVNGNVPYKNQFKQIFDKFTANMTIS